MPLAYDSLLAASASAIYGPDTNFPKSAGEILRLFNHRQASAAA